MAIALLGIGGCTIIDERATCVGGDSMVRTELYFGLNVGETPMDPEQFERFVDREIAGRFSEGFTVVPALGAWRDPHGKTIRENSRVLIRVHAQTQTDEAEISAITDAYKREFKQEAVLRIDTPSCVRF
jgi:hypothetical protein